MVYVSIKSLPVFLGLIKIEYAAGDFAGLYNGKNQEQ